MAMVLHPREIHCLLKIKVSVIFLTRNFICLKEINVSPGRLAHFYGDGFSFVYLRLAGGEIRVAVIRETAV